MREETLQALDEIMDALRVILEDPHFQPVPDRPRTWLGGVFRSLSSTASERQTATIRANLEEVRRHSPSKLDVLEKAFSRSHGLAEGRPQRESSALHQFMLAPLVIPRAFSVFGLFAFSSRDAQFGFYYLAWFVEIVAACALAGWLSPRLIPGIVLWFVAAEFVDRDLEIEEAWHDGYLFALLTVAGNMEVVLELCREKGIGFGKLLQVSEHFVLFEMPDPAEAGSAAAAAAEPAPGRPDERVS